MREIPKNIDAAVVGGGLAGLTAAVLLAESGQRVAVFERSESIGGRAVTQVKDGFHFNLGPHAWYTGGPGTGVLARLGVRLPGRSPKPAGAFALLDDRLHTLPIGFVSLLTTDLLGVHGKIEAARMLARLSRLDTAPFDGQTFSDWLDAHVRDPRVRDVLSMFVRVAVYANAPELMSAGTSLSSFQLVLRHNVLYLDRGWQSIVDALRALADARRVQVIRSAPVAEVIREDAVRGVRLSGGETVSAPNVVLAVPPDLAAGLVPDMPARVVERWSGVASKAACLDLGLARLPKHAHTVAFGVDRPLYYSVHSATADLAPAMGATIHVAKYLDPMTSHDPSADRGELEDCLDRLQPGWRSEIVVQRYLPAMTVANAIPLAAANGLKGRPGVEVSELPGLFLAGDWVGPEGTLANASIASAAQAAKLIGERQCAARPRPLQAGAVA
jgi:phytoene dehydrogenase-like protein